MQRGVRGFGFGFGFTPGHKGLGHRCIMKGRDGVIPSKLRLLINANPVYFVSFNTG